MLVILGLLTGGILAGQSLIRAAGLRSVNMEYQRYVAATQSFRDKYFALPGDMTNATSFWGAADGSTGVTAACKTTASTNATTCNGNGDGMIGYIVLAYTTENLRFWQHLANAGLIEGKYNGVIGTTPNENQIGTNVPGSKLDSYSFWFPQYEPARTGIAGRFDNPANGNVLFFGGWQGTYRANLAPEDAWNIDKKMDDGKPAFGKMQAPPDAAYSASGTPCTTATNTADTAATYLLTNTNRDCEAFFVHAF